MASNVAELLSKFYSFEPDVKASTIEQMKAMDPIVLVGDLECLIHNPDPNVRSAAAEALLRVAPQEAVGLVLPLLTDSIESVRWNTCGLLHDFGDIRVCQALIAVMCHDSEPAVRGIAAWALGAVGDRTTIPILKQVAEADNGIDNDGRSVREHATNALRDIQDRHL